LACLAWRNFNPEGRGCPLRESTRSHTRPTHLPRAHHHPHHSTHGAAIFLWLPGYGIASSYSVAYAFLAPSPVPYMALRAYIPARADTVALRTLTTHATTGTRLHALRTRCVWHRVGQHIPCVPSFLTVMYAAVHTPVHHCHFCAAFTIQPPRHHSLLCNYLFIL